MLHWFGLNSFNKMLQLLGWWRHLCLLWRVLFFFDSWNHSNGIPPSGMVKAVWRRIRAGFEQVCFRGEELIWVFRLSVADYAAVVAVSFVQVFYFDVGENQRGRFLKVYLAFLFCPVHLNMLRVNFQSLTVKNFREWRQTLEALLLIWSQSMVTPWDLAIGYRFQKHQWHAVAAQSLYLLEMQLMMGGQHSETS